MLRNFFDLGFIVIELLLLFQNTRFIEPIAHSDHVVEHGKAERDLQIPGTMAIVLNELERSARQAISIGTRQFHRRIQQQSTGYQFGRRHK